MVTVPMMSRRAGLWWRATCSSSCIVDGSAWCRSSRIRTAPAGAAMALSRATTASNIRYRWELASAPASPGRAVALRGRQAGQQLGQIGRARAGDRPEPVRAQPGGVRAEGLYEREKRDQGVPDRPSEKDLTAVGSGGRRRLGGQPGLADAGVALHDDQLALAASRPGATPRPGPAARARGPTKGSGGRGRPGPVSGAGGA